MSRTACSVSRTACWIPDISRSDRSPLFSSGSHLIDLSTDLLGFQTFQGLIVLLLSGLQLLGLIVLLCRFTGSDIQRFCISLLSIQPMQCRASFARFQLSKSSFSRLVDFSFQVDGARQQSTKPDIRYSVRHKRTDAKSALKDLLLNGKAANLRDKGNHEHSKNPGKSKPQRLSSGKGNHSKRWPKIKHLPHVDEEELPERMFTANFGGQQSFTWSFKTWENNNCQDSTTGFEWKDETKSEKRRERFLNESDIEEDEVNDVDQNSNRIALGLPSSGSLCLDDVKKAFRKSALKWHPDKHCGLAQAMAAEKFKLCVDAYKQLSNALKSS